MMLSQLPPAASTSDSEQFFFQKSVCGDSDRLRGAGRSESNYVQCSRNYPHCHIKIILYTLKYQ